MLTVLPPPLPPGTALSRALDRIDREFGAGWNIRFTKVCIRRALRLGAAHPEVRVRYGRRVNQYSHLPLHTVVHLLKIEHRRLRFDMPPNQLSLQIVDEMRIISRLMRRYPAIKARIMDHAA